MSFAIHYFTAEPISAEAYKGFLCEVQRLFGTWSLSESQYFHDDHQSETMHECWFESAGSNPDESVRVYIRLSKYLKNLSNWGLEYERAIDFETGAGRTSLSLAVQLGALLMAMQHFKYLHVIDIDTAIDGEPMNFPSIETAVKHLRLILTKEFAGAFADLKDRGIADEQGNLILRHMP